MSTKKRLFFLCLLLVMLCSCRRDAPGGSDATTQVPVGDNTAVAPPPAVPLPPFSPISRASWGTLDINALHEQIFAALLERDPQYATELGLAVHYGIKQDRLTDLSDEYAMETAALWADMLQLLREIDPATLTPEQQRSNAILIWDLQDRLALVPFRNHVYPIHQLFSIPSSFPEFMTGVHPLDSQQDVIDYLARMAALEDQFAQLEAGLQKRIVLGLLPPRFVFDRVRPQLQAIITPPVLEHPLYTNFATRLNTLGLPAPEAAELREDAAALLADTVYPAYEGLILALDAAQPEAPLTVGADTMPDGAAYYAVMLAHHNTTALTADQIHAIGLQEVARIQAERAALLEELGFSTDISSSIGRIYNSAGGMQINDHGDRDLVFAAYEAANQNATTELAPLFPLQPRSLLQIEAVPTFREATAPGAYYYPPPLIGSRPGIFFINSPLGSFVSYVGIPTLAFHEGIPGHHFQKAIQRELTGVPTFRRAAHFSAFAEGWALYVEKLAWEYDLYADDPYGNFGRLQSELFRAVRLVVDTGIHAGGWSRVEAIDYMMKNLGWSRDGVTAEVERYIVWPGQATSYKIGELTILRLRDEAAAAMGAQFDLAEFHTLLLQNGDVPLPILEQIVLEWIADR